MIKALRESIVESTVHPIGRKPPEQYPLPPNTHVYGLGSKKNEEGVSISIIFSIYCHSNEKLERTR